jgi:hypothetical protein
MDGESEPQAGPVSSAGAVARRNLACPAHGILEANACTQCAKKPYDLDDADDAATLRSLRRVAKSGRTTKARLIAYPIAASLAVLVVGIGMLFWFAVPLVGEPLARSVERVLRRMQPQPLSELDGKLL